MNNSLVFNADGTFKVEYLESFKKVVDSLKEASDIEWEKLMKDTGYQEK